jgi:hypothetical protein
MSDGQDRIVQFFGDLSRAPDGRPQNLIWFGSAAVFYALAAYSLLTASTVTPFTPLIATGFALNGAAESLPAERQQAAYWTRLLATALMLGLFVLLLVGLLGGPAVLT